MMRRKRAILFAAVSVLALGASALRAQPAPEEAAPPRKPLMEALNQVGAAQPLEKYNINIFGYVEGSYTWNFDQPASDTNFGRVFDFEADELLLNQLDLTVERTIDVTKKQFDLGGRMEWIYGADAGLIHSNGLFDWYDSPRKPENQFDLNQLYVDLAIPVGNGLRIRAGKFVTLMGWETINPTTNALYSHSYLFGFAIPFTHTGAMACYQLNDNWLVEAGFFRGWEQSWEDNNDALSYHFKLGYASTDKKLAGIAQFVTGPEQTGNDSNYRTVIDLQLSYALTDPWFIAANADYGFEQDAAADGSDAQWYGVAGYTGYKLSDQLTLNGRAEWFRDDDGTRLGVAGDFYEVTLGVAITPFPKDRFGSTLILRPELRADFSSENVFDDGNDDTQLTAAIDAIYKF
jgi:hypothetical protein